jgi:hypothetical protein
MGITALEERLSRLEQRIADLERENQSLPVAATTAGVRTENTALPRRDLLRRAVAAAVGSIGISLLGSSRRCWARL